jgi:DNA-binding response OmpR family regulator
VPLVVIIEDDRVVSETLQIYLADAGFDVAVEVTGPAGLDRALQPGVALVVLDWMLPGLNGYEVCRRLRSQSAVPIVMLTARTAEDDRVRGLEAGADDYVPKPFGPREVVARVQAVLRRAGARQQEEGGEAIRFGDLEVDPWRREARVRGERVALTPTEFRLLETLAQAPSRTFTRDELVARVFGPDYDGLDRTVDSHVTNLRRKLGPTRGRRYVATVHGVGYRLVALDDE